MNQTGGRFRYRSPYDQASIFSRFCFAYLVPLFIKSVRNNGLNLEDLPKCPVDDEANRIMKRLEANWNVEKKKRNPNFGLTLIRSFARQYILPFTIFTCEELILALAQPLLLSRVIRYFSGESSVSYREAVICAFGVCLCNLLFVIFDHPTLLRLLRNGMNLRTASCSLMYQKALRLSHTSVGQTQVGQVINIMSNDVARMDDFSIDCIYFFIAPIQSSIIVYIVWTYLGPACFAGVALLLLYIPFQAIMGKLFANVRMGIANLTDSRLRYVNEIVSGIKVIKMYCWERPFAGRVAEARKSEMNKIRKSSFLKAINLATFFVASRVILFVCFLVYVLLGNTLTSEAVFVSMALFNTLRLNMTLLFPNAVTNLAQLKVTCKRIQKFLLLEEISQTPFIATNRTINGEEKKGLTLANGLSDKGPKEEHSHEIRLRAEKITARWDVEDKMPTLKDISVDLKAGDLLAVIGPVGSGKSSFLMSLLNELPIESGTIEVEGKISYASQDAWNFNDSVRNNILFGSEYKAARFQEVIDVCALKRDLKLMPHGDRTLVGEKGISLSGGQKARINLARAVYRDADICLFDDPLSAVDAPVAKHIFEQCIMEYLSEKIRILVTHQIQFIEMATKILVFKEGQCLAYGTYSELQEKGIDFMSLLEDAEEEGATPRERTLSEQCSEVSEKFEEEAQEVSQPDVKVKDGDGDSVIAVQDETYQRGTIKGRIYWAYISAGTGPFLLIFFIFVMILSQALYHGSDIFLTYWTNQNQLEGASKENTSRDIAIYTALVASMFAFAIVRSVTFFLICTRASVRLHNRTFRRLLRSPVSFFDSNPAGRILNRFSTDLGNIDEKIPYVAYDFSVILSQAVGVIVTIAISNWILLFPAFVLAFLIIVLRQIYLKAARDIKRFDGLMRSPVYSHVSTTFNGLASIRAYGEQKAFERQFYVYQSDQVSTWFLHIAASRTMGYFMDLCCAFFIFAITSVVLLSDMAGGTAGLIISSGLMLAGSTQYGVRMSAEFESQMTSVERIVEYQDLEQEAPAESKKGSKPFAEWPSNGQIEFDRMCLAYGETETPVLKNITCTIAPAEKIGIVGRTGAGKSSMIAALFRLTEPTGAIRIDGVDILSIGLDDLRKKISIIPQDPVVFSGTVRYNLDPFSEYPDCDLWSALEEVQLKSQVENFAGQLDAKLSDSGSNLSVGQRQLVCLARAILRRNRILVLDEATASCDYQTDSLIQATLRREFAACTVLTIAHRLNTIIDCDRVLVLDAGVILEFDSPYALLKSKGAFYEMCQKTGPSMYSHLHQLARETYTRKVKLAAESM